MLSSYQDVLAFRQSVLSDFHLNDGANCIAALDDPQAFWQFYRENKDELRHAKIFVYKDGADWICAAKPLYDPETREKELLTADLEKWRESLVGCCVPFERMQVEEHLKRNLVKDFRLRCPVCGWQLTGALPYRVADYLVLDVGLELVLRADRLREQGVVS